VAAGEMGAKLTYKTADFLSKSNFDVRNTKFAKLLSKHTGLNLGEETVSSKTGKGGWDQRQKDKARKESEFAKELMPSGAELSALHLLDGDLHNIQEELRGMGMTTEAQFRTNARYVAVENARNAEQTRLVRKRQTRRDNYADTVENGGSSFVDNIGRMFGFYSPANTQAATNIRSMRATQTVIAPETPISPQTRAIIRALENRNNAT